MDTPQAGTTTLDNPCTMNIPAGSFWLGSPPDDHDAPENTHPGHEVRLPEFSMGVYPVTNAQYTLFVENNGQAAPAHWVGGRVPSDLKEHPVVHVDFEDAVAYCRWLSRMTKQPYRLPTEAEWEKAARGPLPNRHCFVWGDEWRANACNSLELERQRTSSVREFENINRSVLGIVDLAGNVWEWTASWYEPYPGSLYVPKTPGRSTMVVRGGSFHNSSRDAQISIRGRYTPQTRRPYLGFRVVLDALTLPADTASRRTFEPLEIPTLLQCLIANFHIDVLQDLCLYLNIDDARFEHGSRSQFASDLVTYCERADRLAELGETAQRVNPNFPW